MLLRTTACTAPTTILLSVHKGASSFFAEDFAPAMTAVIRGLRHVRYHTELQSGRTPEELALPPTGIVASRIYPPHYDQLVETPVPPEGRFAGKKLVLLRRDPRDVAVSYYYAFAYSHPVPPHRREPFLARRADMLTMPIRDAIARYAVEPACRQFLATADFLVRHPETCLASYEELMNDFDAWLTRVAAHLDWSATTAGRIGSRVRGALKPPKRERPNRHKRRMTPGNWREVFDEQLRARFEERLGDTLEAAGYTW